jgi:phytoene dehydrogenase-like protein
VKGYYLSGSGAHPGGGVMGAPGKMAAEIALNDMEKKVF